jgi:hypothetical protein
MEGRDDQVSEELVFTVAGATALPAQPVSLEEAGYGNAATSRSG